jgi:hypothetical protein
MDNLKGKKIIDMKIASDRLAILFVTETENIIVRADADCCSNTWIENIELPLNPFPCTVISDNDIEMPNMGSKSDDECIKYYGYKIITDKGHIIIDYRNESNGYYGGNLSFQDDGFYGGVYGQNISNEQWQTIK